MPAYDGGTATDATDAIGIPASIIDPQIAPITQMNADLRRAL